MLRFSIQKSAPITIAQDSSDNYGGLKTENYEHVPDVIFSHFAKQGFIGFSACAILKQNWIINNACSIPPQDAIRPGYKLTSREETTKQEDVEIIERISKTKYHILDLASKAVEKRKCSALVWSFHYSRMITIIPSRSILTASEIIPIEVW